MQLIRQPEHEWDLAMSSATSPAGELWQIVDRQLAQNKMARRRRFQRWAISLGVLAYTWMELPLGKVGSNITGPRLVTSGAGTTSCRR